MNRLINLIIMAAIIVATCWGCSYSHLHVSKYYVVESIEGNSASFIGVEGIYSMDTKNLKKGQKIWLQRTYNKKKANVTIINH